MLDQKTREFIEKYTSQDSELVWQWIGDTYGGHSEIDWYEIKKEAEMADKIEEAIPGFFEDYRSWV